ncbi:MAG: helix-turn-helix transcriptional regulator [Candidatus Limnocylindrales bacterium]
MSAMLSNASMELDPCDARNFIEFAASETDIGELDHADAEAVDNGDVEQATPEPTLTVEERFGTAVLRLRLYRGWSQRDLQHTCGVHQSQISRLEAGRQRGMSIRRVFAILRALRVDVIAFVPRPPASPPTDLELMLWGDPWERAGRAADRRSVNRRRNA